MQSKLSIPSAHVKWTRTGLADACASCIEGASIGQRVQYECEWLHRVNEKDAAVGGNYNEQDPTIRQRSAST